MTTAERLTALESTAFRHGQALERVTAQREEQTLDVAALHADVIETRDDMTALRDEVTEVRGDVARLESKVDQLTDLMGQVLAAVKQ